MSASSSQSSRWSRQQCARWSSNASSVDNGVTECRQEEQQLQHGEHGDATQSTHPTAGSRSSSKLCVSSIYVLLLAAGMLVACTAYMSGYVSSHRVLARDTDGKKVCRNQVCKDVARSIARSLNRSVDPCKNFYRFVCDGWRRKHPVRRNEVRSSPFSLVGRELDAVIKRALSKVPITAKKQGALEKAALMYHECLKNYDMTNSTESMMVLRELLHSLRMPWPSMEPNHTTDLFEIIVQLSLRWSIPSLFSLSVIPDPEDTKTNVLVINTMENLEVGFRQLQANNQTKNDTQDIVFMKMVQKVAAIMGDNKTDYKMLAERCYGPYYHRLSQALSL
ncbi:hypothetical protein HPB48_002801 [Haemaphysalis longicornis]|uniref:Peptidase M13 N-terminal domain-containing protein n=1 Tax=Haemaphysalis longicornis TaxID=44386 RepID=A0A9J6GND1_HAELO|nr:hypothetical protein HPB48_002801 [Haemaphysalis longicornis]